MKRTGFRRPSSLKVSPVLRSILIGLVLLGGLVTALVLFTPPFLQVLFGGGRVISDPLPYRIYVDEAPLWEARIFAMKTDFAQQERNWWIVHLPTPGRGEGALILMADPVSKTIGLPPQEPRSWELWAGRWLFQVKGTDRFTPLKGVNWQEEDGTLWTLPAVVPIFGNKVLSLRPLEKPL